MESKLNTATQKSKESKVAENASVAFLWFCEEENTHSVKILPQYIAVYMVILINTLNVQQQHFLAVGQTHAKWQAFEKPEIKRNVWYLTRARVD